MNSADTCLTAELFVKLLIQMQHQGVNPKLRKKEVPVGRKHIHTLNYQRWNLHANKDLQRKEERKQRSNPSLTVFSVWINNILPMSL